MILGHDSHIHSRCFEELDTAVSALTDRTVCFNAHHFQAPAGAIIYNLENVPLQVPDPARLWAGHEVWDFSDRSAAVYGAKHVPVGYHPSMKRFERRPPNERDIDVVFAGCMNERRNGIINALRAEGLRVCVVPGEMYGAERDLLLARAKLALNIHYNPAGTFEQLRVAHLVANGIPVLSEVTEDMDTERWNIDEAAYVDIVPRTVNWLEKGQMFLDGQALGALETFVRHPLVLP